jgi:hypothetical protein
MLKQSYTLEDISLSLSLHCFLVEDISEIQAQPKGTLFLILLHTPIFYIHHIIRFKESRAVYRYDGVNTLLKTSLKEEDSIIYKYHK